MWQGVSGPCFVMVTMLTQFVQLLFTMFQGTCPSPMGNWVLKVTMLCGGMQAAYAFKATYQNGGHGLTFSNLHDYNNHWIYATCVCAVETVLAIALALYLEQVLSSGTGVRRHPLFFLKKKKSADGGGEAAPRSRKSPIAFLKKNRGSGQEPMTETALKPGMSVLRTLFMGRRPQQSGAAASKVIQVPNSPPPPLSPFVADAAATVSLS